MKREDFIAKHRNLLCGLIADAMVSQKTGATLAVTLRNWFRQVDVLLGHCYEDLQGDPHVNEALKPTTGSTTTPRPGSGNPAPSQARPAPS